MTTTTTLYATNLQSSVSETDDKISKISSDASDQKVRIADLESANTDTQTKLQEISDKLDILDQLFADSQWSYWIEP